MAKFPTYPTLYDNLKTLSITFLKEPGYLKLNQWLSGNITWSRNGNKTGWISFVINTADKTPYIELDYNYNETPIKYKVKIVSILSNLGNGYVWYFLCPVTGKHCRKLYLHNGYFLHREAI